MKIKRLISALIIVSMVLQMFCIFPASAEVGSKIYEYDGYSVEYSITNEWDGGQTTELKITNTSDESILNWTLKCNIEGEISNLWNAQIYDRNETTYIFKNCGWNYEIRPNESVTFGYTLSGDNSSAPDSFTSCSERKTLTLGYSVDMNITSTWDTGVQGEITIANTSDEPLEAWCLSFDSSFTMDNIWDVRVLSNDDNHYVLASESWRNPIDVGETLTIGFVGIVPPETPIEISNVSLSVVVIDENAGETSIFDKLIISAYGGYALETEDIDIAWLSTIPKGVFDVVTSEDNGDYTVVGSVTDADSYSLPVQSAQKYIKVRQTAGSQIAESEPLVLTKTENGYVVDYIDTDGDGLYDYIENAIGTDKDAPDSDNDGLSDYEEMLLTNSDPVVYNSINERLSDSEADSDSDGLSNITEIELGTNPLNPDSDGDGLSDGDEVDKYNTDSNKYDTDDDSISDSDELAVGLNPNDPQTFGMPDAEYKFEQVISAESEALSKINTAENPYKLSVKMKAGGYAEGGLTAGETVYSNILENDSMLGIAAELSYPSAYEAEDIVLSFELSEEYVYDYYVERYSGVNRYNVFKYFEDVNMLLPIPTEYNVENNTLSAEVDEFGTYCVMDMVSWFSGMDIPIEDEQAQPMLMSLRNEVLLSDEEAESDDVIYITASEYCTYINTNEISESESVLAVSSEEPVFMSTFSAVTLSADEEKTESEETRTDIPIDVVFILQTESAREDEFETQKRAIIGSSNMLFNYFEDVRIHIIYFNYDEAVYFMNGYFTDVDSLVEHIDSIPFIYSELERYCNKTAAHNILLNEIDFRDYSNKFVFDFFNGWAETRLFYDVCESNRFNYSEFSPHEILYANEQAKQRYENLISSTGGIIFIYDENVKYSIYHHVLGGNGPVRIEYDIVYPFNWKKIALDKQLKRDGDTDTDDDTLTDWQEIVKTGIALDASDYVIPPTIRQYVYATNNEYLIDYMESLLEDEECTDELKKFINNTQILQVSSLPTSPDSDYDGLLDGEYQYRDGTNEIIAPIDQNKLRYDGPIGMWKEHIKTAQSSVVATELGDWYYNMSEKKVNENTGDEGFEVYKANVEKWAEKSGNPFSAYFIKHWGNVMYDSVQKLDVASFLIASGLFIAEIENSFPNEGTREIIYASLGSQALNFKMDNKCWSLHSQYNTWQSIGGYNNFYDFVFKTANNDNMEQLKLDFFLNMSPMDFFDKYGITETMGILDAFDSLSPTTDFIIWAWRGDYLNIGAGSEVGIYMRPHYWDYDTNGLDQYFTIKQLAVPMTLYLYNYDFALQTVESNLVAWEPTTPQWWITGFNPDTVGQANVKKQVTISSVDLSRFADSDGKNEMFDNLKIRTESNDKKSQFTIFDENNDTMWLMWYGESAE